MLTERQVGTLEQAVGVALLNMAEHLWDLVPHRSETVEILDHDRAIRRVTLQVDLHTFAGEATERWPPEEEIPDRINRPHLRRTLVRWRGRILVPLTLLRYRSDDSPHVTNESGELVPRLPENELRTFLRAGLIAIARTAVGRQPLEPSLFSYLWETDVPTHRVIRTFVQGPALVADLSFRTAMRYTTGYRYLVVPVHPDKGSRRVFTYKYIQPINERGDLQPDRIPPIDEHPATRGSIRRTVANFYDRFQQSGQTVVNIPLGDISDCRRYELEVAAPYDTLYDRAWMGLRSDLEGTVDVIACDCSHRTKVRFSADNEPIPKMGILTAQLYAQRTGVIRSSTLSAPFTLLVLSLGALDATLIRGHIVGQHAEDAAAALLLLFAGVIGGVLAAPGKHPITATMQFPTRLVLWAIGVASYFPAAIIALRVRGYPALAVWFGSTAACAVATWQVLRQWHRLSPTRV